MQRSTLIVLILASIAENSPTDQISMMDMLKNYRSMNGDTFESIVPNIQANYTTDCCQEYSCPNPCYPHIYPPPPSPIVVPARTFYEPVVHNHPPLHVIKKIIARDKKKWRYDSTSEEFTSSDTDDSGTSTDYSSVPVNCKIEMKPKNTNYKHAQDNKTNYVLMALGILLVVLPIVTLFVDPVLIAMKFLTRMAVGSQLYTMLREEVPGAFVSVYIFNITNGEAFVSGEDYKLKVEQVGPFTYQEYHKNEGFELDEEAGVMRYTPLATAQFIPEQSIADPRQVNITIINTVMLALASMLSSYSVFGQSGYNMLINQLQSKPFLNIDVDSYFWGYEDPLIALGHTLMPGWITFQRLGILDRLYDPSAVPRLELGIYDEDKLNIRTVNGCPGLKVWQYENPSKRSRCNTLTDAYEGFAFPAGLTPDRALRLYRNVFCRMLDLVYVETKVSDLVPEIFVYEIRNDSFAINAESNCLCGEYECIEGVSSAAPCLFGFDLALSFGHFWNADPKVYERIDGMRPDGKEHGSEFLVDPISGAVLDTRFTLQLNLIVRDVRYNSLTKPFSEMVIPMAYLKIVQPPLPDEAKNLFRFMYLVFPNIILGLQIITFIIGFTMIVYTVRKLYWKVVLTKGIDFMDASNENRVHVPHSETPLVEEKTLDETEYRLDTR
ncbi:unnamed protein product [Danaus chrysippus]|uniref:(African queen) hypothetical protein n=1 Tax=Danaus chrysippus TaxID=151541 RepID=A0A8J2R503_9NEOP|nr:unnamed protein product [Danaus chrysippus]